MRVLLTWQASPEEISTVRSRLPSDIDVVAVPPRPGLSRFDAELADVIELGRTAQVFFGWVVPRAAVEEASELRFISFCGAGVDSLPLDVIRRREIQLANAAGVYSVPVAEHAFALLLASAKRLIVNHQAAVEARWLPRREPGYASVELSGTTIAIIGFGGIGTNVARFARAFGMNVLAVSRGGNVTDSLADEVHDMTSLHDVLARADFVVLCLPLTNETRRIIDDVALQQFKHDAYLINVARAGLVDEQALYESLTSDRIGGYATDTWWDYSDAVPTGRYFGVPSRLGIHRLPNVIGTGNRAASTIEGIARYIEHGTENVVAFLRGERPRHLVDLELGY